MTPQPKLVAMLMLLAIAPATLRPQSLEPPASGRPEDFSGLVGSYEIASRASPTELAVLEPLALTIKITPTSKEPPPAAPQRSDLHVFPSSLARDFYVEPLPDVAQPGAQAWEFVYRLRPKTAAVKRIPALKLTYYDPRFGRYQVSYSQSISLNVKPPMAAEPPHEENGRRPPEHVYLVVTGPAVLRREEGSVDGRTLLTFALLAPPAACALWYAVWRKLRPDERRRARLQRSRAARDALRQLQALRAASGEQAALLVAEYLTRRLSMTVADPTPAEAWATLRRARVSPLVASKVCEFFHACDASRFAPESMRDGQNLAAQAENFIHAVEAEPCLLRHI
jgi:hypothetical protein